MIWFWSDTHFDHDNVIRFCARPFADVAEMNAALVNNYRKSVRSADTVYFVGDIFFGTYAQSKAIIDQLPGKKILIQGNHDKFSQQQYTSLGFHIVLEEAVLRLFGRRIRLCHYPRRPSIWRRLFGKPDIRYMERRPVFDGRWLLHGHTHSAQKINVKKRMIHVGVDAWDYTPVKITDIESLVARSEKK